MPSHLRRTGPSQDVEGWLAVARGPHGRARHAACPAPDPGAHRAPATDTAQAAAAFIRQHHAEEELGDPARRIAEVDAELAATGTYTHTPRELEHGARLAWRNANRCIGRLYWRSLHVRDLRHLDSAEEIAEACADHLRQAAPGGRIRPLITVFAPDRPGRPGPRIWNDQLIRYAGYVQRDGHVIGDPRAAGLTAYAQHLGWRAAGTASAFDVLPLIVQEAPHRRPRLFGLPPDAILEVPLEHPELTWWAELGLRWYAVPALANMCLEIGGICYGAAPFNGWYMGTEIGARNLADTDRYNLLPHLAHRLGLDTATDRSLWKDRALVELNRSVLHSFDRAGVTITDHHTESVRFLTHLEREESRGRTVGADWSWIVPPLSGSTTPVFHRTYDDVQHTPTYVHHPEAHARARGEDAVPARHRPPWHDLV
ncbi:nitric oxide synthase oxygenase [Streptomyces sp. NPDC057694]|uniref:nitric oxide synthase oxygenase n=1 Tax=Streptomyces sp. NPDC057694 TaxID=3346216 RepID=UPI00367A9056